MVLMILSGQLLAVQFTMVFRTEASAWNIHIKDIYISITFDFRMSDFIPDKRCRSECLNIILHSSAEYNTFRLKFSINA